MELLLKGVGGQAKHNQLSRRMSQGLRFQVYEEPFKFQGFWVLSRKDIKVIEKDIGLVNENKGNLVQRKRKQELERTATIKASCQMYDPNFTTEEVMDYLKNLARITSRTLRATFIEDEDS